MRCRLKLNKITFFFLSLFFFMQKEKSDAAVVVIHIPSWVRVSVQVKEKLFIPKVELAN